MGLEWRPGEADSTCGPSSAVLLDLHGGAKAVLSTFLCTEAQGNAVSPLRSFPCYSEDKEVAVLLIPFLLVWTSGAHSRHAYAAAHWHCGVLGGTTLFSSCLISWGKGVT